MKWNAKKMFNSIQQICPNLELLTPEKFLYIMSAEGFIAANLP